MPSLKDASESEEAVAMMVVSHGVLLKHIFRQFTLRLPARTIYMGSWRNWNVVCSQSLNIRQWSNTGYLELHFSPSTSLHTQGLPAHEIEYRKGMGGITKDWMTLSVEPMKSGSGRDKLDGHQSIPSETDMNIDETNMQLMPVPERGKSFPFSWVTLIVTVNGTAHLRSLKRTGGGIGSAKFDKCQTTLHKFL